MIIPKICKDCDKLFNIGEGSDENYDGQFYRPSTKELIWLCPKCRPKKPKTIMYEEIIDKATYQRPNKYIMCKCMHINNANNYVNDILKCEKCKKTLSRKV